MLPPKALIEAVNAQAARLLSGELPLSRTELEVQLKVLIQGALSRLDVVSRDEFDNQALVLAHTRARLEDLEQRVQSLEQRLTVLHPMVIQNDKA